MEMDEQKGVGGSSEGLYQTDNHWGKRIKGWGAPHLSNQQTLETKSCSFQHETPGKDTEKDDVGKEY